MNYSDLASDDFISDPYRFYDEVRSKGALVEIGPGILITMRASVVEALMLDRRLGKSGMAPFRGRYGNDRMQDPVFRIAERMFTFSNPPEHTPPRAKLAGALNSRNTEGIYAIVQEIADRLIDGFVNKGCADLVADYAWRLPMEVICTLLDLPIEDGIQLQHAVSRFNAIFNLFPIDQAGLDAANDAARELAAYFSVVLADRRKRPGADLLSALLQIERDGYRMNDEDITANAIALFVAGYETTANMIGNALISFYRFPDQLQLVLRDPSLLPRAVEECLRHNSTIQMVARLAMETIEDGEIRIPKGAVVLLGLAGANRDPARFHTPNQLMINRAEKARMLTFGTGIHYCIGARLAAIEMEIALGTLFARLDDMQLVNTDRPEWRNNSNLRGPASLLATWVLSTSSASDA
jgi:cytochrome P450